MTNKQALLCAAAMGWCLANQADAEPANEPTSQLAAPVSAGAPPAPSQRLEEVVVTARKRSESIQKIPVAVTAITTEQLREKSITNPYDLTFNAPGLNVREGGGTRESPDFFMRGQGNTFTGNPSVQVYFNEVPLQSLNVNLTAPSSNLQYFDLANVQVLKGPQGTLFGKSSTGGAVLYSPIKPSNEFGGYIDGQAGNYGMWETQGAINVPIIDDILAIRFAADVVRRDGFTQSLSTGQEQDERHREGYRLGVNFTPTSWLKSYTLAQIVNVNEVPSSGVLLDYDKNFPLFNTTPGIGAGYYAVAGLCSAISAPSAIPGCIATRTGRINQLVSSLASEQARLAAGGSIRENQTTMLDKQNFRTETIENTSSVNIGEVPLIGDVTFKNIFSALRIGENNVIREFGATPFNDGVVINQYDLIGLPPQQLSALGGGQTSDFGENTTEEFQIQGNINKRHSWILGYFIAQAHQDTLGVPPIFTSFNNAFTVPLDNPSFLYTTIPNKTSYSESGFYGQFTADLSDLVDGLHLTGGARESRDYTKQSFVKVTPTPTGLQAGAFDHAQNFEESAPSFTVALDYQVTPDILTYITTRRGYKPGGVNGTAASTAPIPGLIPTFQSEELDDVEAGIKSTWQIANVRGRSNLAVYHSWYSDIQRSQTLALPPSLGGGVTTQTNNIAAAEITGLELENTFKITKDLSLFLNYAWIDAAYTQYPGVTINDAGVAVPNINSPYVGAPTHQLTVGGRYLLPIDPKYGPVSVTADYYRQSGIWLDDSALQESKPLGFQPGYGNLNLRLDWNNIFGRPIDMAFFVRNATNDVHLVGVNNIVAALGFVSGTYNEPRMWGFELRYRFGDDAE